MRGRTLIRIAYLLLMAPACRNVAGGLQDRGHEPADVMAFADSDLDGDLDGYLVTHRLGIGPAARLPRSGRESLDRAVIRKNPGGLVEVTPAYRELFEIIDKGGGRLELLIAGQADHFFRSRR
jgi:hypothetical protein